MTTTSDKLLARADEYERKAQMLRFAAAELNGEAMNGKRKTLVGTLDAAIALRKAQNGHQPRQFRPGNGRVLATMAERAATVRAFLKAADGPQTSRAIADQLAAAGQGCSTSWVLRVMREMKDVHPRGKGHLATWGLGKAPKKQGPTTREQQHAKRGLIAKVLDLYDTKEPREPGAIAKSVGLSIAQTGFAPLVNQGYLAKRKGGYIRTAKTYIVTPASAQP